MVKRVCDKCGKEITKQRYYEFIINVWNGTDNNSDDTNWDLCEDCYKDIQKLIEYNRSFTINWRD